MDRRRRPGHQFDRPAEVGLVPVLVAAEPFAHGEVVVIDGSGHFPWVEQPAAFRRAADPFVA